MSKVTELEDRRGLSKAERSGLYPPPFLGPTPQGEIQFYQDRHGDSQPQTKTKKSLAEKISRTLDKIAAVTSSPGNHRDDGRRRPGGGGGLVYPVYAGYSPGYRTVRGPHGVSYQYVYTGWEPGLYHQEYHGAPSPSHYLPSSSHCRCPSSGTDSVRSRTGQTRCKKCSKPKTPYSHSQTRGPPGKVRARLQIPGELQHSPVQTSMSRAKPGGPRDPYDYIRRTRLKADDWDTYWETSQLEEVTPSSKHSPATTKSAHSYHNIKHSRSSPEARRVVSQFDPRTIQTPPANSAPGKKLDQKQEARETKTSDRRQPLEMRVTACDLMEDEDSSQPESKPISNSDTSVKSSEPELQGQSDCDQDNNNNSQSQRATNSESDESDCIQDTERDLSAALLADLVSMKSKISVAEMRYRKFQRRNPLRKLSLQIDEVIIEEDEDALENEDLENQSLSHTSSLPTVCENDEEKSSSSSDDEFGIGKFKKVIGDSNFADEILSEIYGATGEVAGRCSLAGEPEEMGETAASRSLADEILDELYGSRGAGEAEEDRQESPEYCNIEDLRQTEAEEETGVSRAGQKSRLFRSASLQEKTPGMDLSLMLNDTTRFKLSHRPSLLGLLGGEDQADCVPALPGTPTLHRPRIPPPPPPTNHPLLQPFNSFELRRINSVIQNNDTPATNDEDYSGSEFSDGEFDDPIDIDYENIPVEQRPPPEGAEADSEYDVPELNESFELGGGLTAAQDDDDDCEKETTDLDTSFTSSTCIGDISADSLVLPRLVDTSFDRDSIDSEYLVEDKRLSSHSSVSGSVIQNDGKKTIILSPAMAAVAQSRQTESKIYISSSSWINIQSGGTESTVSSGAGQSSSVHIVTEEEPEGEEPVKPPRLKKLARQQSKQEMLRAKGFGVTANTKPNISSITMGTGATPLANKSIKGLSNNNNSKSRPEISQPILINSTMNSEDFQNHKCITLNRSDVPFLLHGGEDSSDNSSVYRAHSSDTDSSLYNPESVSDETYSNDQAGTDIYNEHIYEEIPETGNKIRPLPPIPEGSSGNITSKSIFTGATKYEILHYLNDARQRMDGNVVEFDNITEDAEAGDIQNFLGTRNHKHRVSAISNLSDSSSSSNESSSGDGSVKWRGSLDKVASRVEVERNDSGVGSDSGMSSCKLTGAGAGGEVVTGCEDCEVTLTEDETICSKCVKKRGERKEIINEIIDTETKYGGDLRIIVEEFYRPMLVAGLLSSDQLASIFLNVEQLIQVNTSFTSQLKEALDEAASLGDEDLLTVKVGSLFITAMPMLQAFEAYCTKQAASSMLLANVEREKELLRVFLKVSQMENKILRRMNLSSFLMVPVQRVTKYPLLLARLLKVTPGNHRDRDNIREAQTRIESALEQINKDAKEIIAMKGSWRRGGQSNKKMGLQREMNNMRVRKLSLEMLGWTREDTRFALEGRLTFAQVNDSNWKAKLKGTVNSGLKLMTANALLVVTSKPGIGSFNFNLNNNNNNISNCLTPGTAELHTSTNIIFPKLDTIGEAVLLLIREKTSRFATVRDPFFLDKTIICSEQDWDQEYFEIHEFGSKDSYIFKADEANMTATWYQALQFYSQCLGGWRRRRKGLGNIMVDPNLN